MPIETVQQSIHIRRKKNAVVFDNLERLWRLQHEAKSHQDILDGLHPWNAPIPLKFDNFLPAILFIIGLCCALIIVVKPSSIYFQLSFFIGLMMMFWAWISFEKKTEIDKTIKALEDQVIKHKYQLDYFKQPTHIDLPLQPVLMMTKIKQMFPVFDVGSYANDIPLYASSTWQDENGQDHPVMVFEYRYIDEVTVRDKDGDEVRVKLIERSQWGVLVFKTKLKGLAVTSMGRKFYHPYSYPWQTSDISLTQKIKIYGSDPLNTAKQMSPSLVLKFAEFFDTQDGHLLFHPTNDCLCFIGPKNLFQISKNKRKIEDISALRGHLRTFKLVHLERLQQDLLKFLQ